MPSETSHTLQQQQLKRKVGETAAGLIEDNMVVGLGTGSTAVYFIEALIKRCHEGLIIRALATSKASEEQAKAGGIPLIDLKDIDQIDITVDGADEIDPQKRLIKGGGGALFREKIIASASKELIIIADESKCVEALGFFPLPVEIVPFGYTQTVKRLKELGYTGKLRQKNASQEHYLTDNGNYIIDIKFSSLRKDPNEDHRKIKEVLGVVETGFFINLAGRILIAQSQGNILVIP